MGSFPNLGKVWDDVGLELGALYNTHQEVYSYAH
jgi:hypothetical protein